MIETAARLRRRATPSAPATARFSASSGRSGHRFFARPTGAARSPMLMLSRRSVIDAHHLPLIAAARYYSLDIIDGATIKPADRRVRLLRIRRRVPLARSVAPNPSLKNVRGSRGCVDTCRVRSISSSWPCEGTSTARPGDRRRFLGRAPATFAEMSNVSSTAPFPHEPSPNRPSSREPAPSAGDASLRRISAYWPTVVGLHPTLVRIGTEQKSS